MLVFTAVLLILFYSVFIFCVSLFSFFYNRIPAGATPKVNISPLPLIPCSARLAAAFGLPRLFHTSVGAGAAHQINGFCVCSALCHLFGPARPLRIPNEGRVGRFFLLGLLSAIGPCAVLLFCWLRR